MIITGKKIKELKDLFKKHKIWQETLSDLLKVAQDRNGKNLIKLEREGKELNLAEEVLWKELYYGGQDTQAGKILFEKYPDIKEAQDMEEKSAAELRDYTITNLGFVFNQMTLIDLMELIMAIRRYELVRFFFLDRIINLYYDIFGKKK